jgi:acetyl esterase/lipase
MRKKDTNVFQSRTISPDLLKDASKIIKDVSYAHESPNQVLDIYLPKKAKKPYPVIVYFHGGAFRFGDKDDSAVEPMLRGLKKGYSVVSAQYRLSGEALFPAMVYDAKTVIRFVRAMAKTYGFDPEKIAAWGPSSGGWLVSMLGVTAENPAFEDESQGYSGYPSNVECVVDWCGPVSGFV